MSQILYEIMLKAGFHEIAHYTYGLGLFGNHISKLTQLFMQEKGDSAQCSLH